MADTATREVPRFKVRYQSEVRDQLKDTLGLDNVMDVPRFEKIVVNMGVGDAVANSNLLEGAVRDLTVITGQKPLVTRAKKSISGFKLRENQEIGCMVTLRGARMYEFLDRLISLALPRVRDFRGLNPKAFDGRGNYSMGLTEQLVFPEVNPDSVHHTQGMNITMVTTTNSDDEARLLLREMGLPLQADNADKKK